MLYDWWHQIAQMRSTEIALTELGSGRSWTFAQLDADADAGTESIARDADESHPDVAYPSGMNAAFILQTIAAWRRGRVLCPLELGAVQPALTGVPPTVAHLKVTSATSGAARLVA